MKKIVMATMVCFLSLGLGSSCAEGKSRTEVDRLWKEYDKAVEDDLPQKAAGILQKIKDRSRAERLSYDFYRAATQYVQTKTQRDWKARERLTEEMNAEFRSYGDPVILYVSGLDFNRGDASECSGFLEKWAIGLKSGHSSDFWEKSPIGYKDEVLRTHIHDDYEYVLLSMAFSRSLMNSRGYEKIADIMKSVYTESYPVVALHELFCITSGNIKDYEKYAKKYKGKATSTLAKLNALPLKFRELGEDKAGEEEYRRLREYCEALVSEKKGFSGEERLILKDEDAAEKMIEELDSKNLEAEVHGCGIEVRLRNLPDVKISVYAGEKLSADKLTRKDVPVWEKSLENVARSYYVNDTLKAQMPELPDGEYLAVFESGKIRQECRLSRHSVAMSANKSADGWLLYAADRLSGKPAGEVELTVGSWNGKELLRKKVRFSGARLMDSEVQAVLKGVGGRCWVQCSLTDARGFARSSEKLSLYTTGDNSPQAETDYQAQVLTDRSAYRPGETLNFKAILYKDYRTGKMSVAPAGEKVKVSLADAENKEVQSVELTTNEYGSVAGKFDIPYDRRNGEWRIAVLAGGYTVNAKWFTVDEFRLPEFSVTFIHDGVKYFPGDVVPVRGRVFSYAGKSLSDAKVEYRVSDWNGVVAKGTPELDGQGNFTIPVKTEFDRDSYFTVTLSVTDGAGQTLDFSAWLRVGTEFGISAELKDAAEGGFTKAGGQDGVSFSGFYRGVLTRSGVLKGHKSGIEVALEDCDGERLDGEIDWVLRSGSETLKKGVCNSGKTLEIELAGNPSGLYTVEFSKTYEYTAAGGKKEKAGEKLVYELLMLGDTVLDADLENAFKVVGSDNEIALLFGAAHGEVWANVMLFDLGSHLLKNESLRLDGVRGKEGSLKRIGWEYDAAWSDKVLLRVEYFKDGRYRTFEHEYQRGRSAFELPLSVSTFTDSCLPGVEYRVTLRTGKAAEVLAAVFDKSTEDIRSNVWSAVMPAFSSIYVDSDSSTGCEFSGLAGGSGRFWRLDGNGDRLMAKSAGVMASAPVADSVESTTEEALPLQKVEEKPGFSDDSESVSPLKIRKDFQSTLAFEPFLRSDGDGNAEFRFRTSDRLSTYILALFAHDKAFHNATLRREFIVSRPVTITVHEPSLLYGGDRYTFRPSVSNNSGKAIDGTLTVFVYDGDEGTQPTSVQNCPLSLEAGKSANRDFAIIVQDAASMKSYRSGKARLSIKAVFNAHGDKETEFSDALLVTIPVLDGRQALTESHSALFRTGMDKDALVRSLEGQFVNTTPFGAVMRETRISGMIAETLSQKAELRSDNLLDVSELLYVRLVSGNEDDAETGSLVKKLLDCRCEDGGFAWFAGMSSSPVLTAVLLERLALLREDGLLPEGTDWSGILTDAVRYLDRQMFTERGGRHWFGGISMGQYAYVRSFFPDIAVSTKSIKAEVGARRFKEVVKELRGWLQPSAKDDVLNGRILEKARRNAAILNLVAAESDAFGSSMGLKYRKMKKTLARNVESLKEYAVEHPSGGFHYPNAVMPFRAILSSEAYAHSILCDMLTRWSRFSELSSGKADARAEEIADGIRLWLMVQKETQQWQSSFEFINAINSVRKGSPALLETSVISLTKTWEKPFEEIRAAGNGFSIKREFLVEELVPSTVKGQEGITVPKLRELSVGETLTVGQKVVVRYSISSDENRSLVHIRTPYNACLRPVRQLSGNYGYALRDWRINAATGGAGAWWITPQGYREVLESAIDYWFDVYPEQNTTIEDEFHVSQSGVFTAPVCEIESLYAPHYRANSAFTGSITVAE